MKSFDDGGPLDQLFAKARELAGEDPETRRRKVVDHVVRCAGLRGPKERVARFVVERVYDRIFGGAAHAPVDMTDRCRYCGLNDGHHYVGCRALGGENQ